MHGVIISIREVLISMQQAVVSTLAMVMRGYHGTVSFHFFIVSLKSFSMT